MPGIIDMHVTLENFLLDCEERNYRFARALESDGSYAMPTPFVSLGENEFVFVYGDNATGKSLYLKCFEAISSRLGIACRSSSMRNRTSGEFGQKLIFGEEKDESTGFNSLNATFRLLKSMQQDAKPTVGILDEPTVGLASNYIVSLSSRIIEGSKSIGNPHLIFIATHDKAMAEHFMSLSQSIGKCSFLGVDGKNPEEWLSDNEQRDIREIEDRGRKLFRCITDALRQPSGSSRVLSMRGPSPQGPRP